MINEVTPVSLAVAGAFLTAVTLISIGGRGSRTCWGLILFTAANVVLSTDAAQNMSQIQTLTLGVLVFFILLPTVFRLRLWAALHVHYSYWLIVALVAYLTTINWWHVQTHLGNETLLRLIALLPIATLALYTSILKPTLEDVRDALSLGLGSALTLSVLSDTVWSDCSLWKCNAAGGLLRGPFGTENTFGWVLGMVVVFHVLSWSTKVSLPVVVISSALLFLTSSRTAQLACIAAVLAASCFHACKNLERQTGLRTICTAFLLGWFALSVAVLFVQDPGFASQRGYIWMQAVEVLSGRELLGAGVDSWVLNQRIGLLPHHFPHSQYMLLFFSGGAVALALFGMLIMTVAQVAYSKRSAQVFGILIFFIVSSTFEITWNPMTIDYTVISVVGLIVVLVSDNKPHVTPKSKAELVEGGVALRHNSSLIFPKASDYTTSSEGMSDSAQGLQPQKPSQPVPRWAASDPAASAPCVGPARNQVDSETFASVRR